MQVDVLEFSRDRKMMSTLCQRAGGRPMLFVKGAPEAILDRCTQACYSPPSTACSYKPTIFSKTTEFLQCCTMARRSNHYRLARVKMCMQASLQNHPDQASCPLILLALAHLTSIQTAENCHVELRVGPCRKGSVLCQLLGFMVCTTLVIIPA